MSLKVYIKDKNTNEILNNDGPIIFVDESISMIKEKLFCTSAIVSPENPDFTYYPNFVNFQIKVNDYYKDILDKSSLLFNFEKYPKEFVIYADNVFNLSKDSVFLSKLINAYIVQDEKILDEIYTDLQKNYEDLSEEDFQFIIKMFYAEEMEKSEVGLPDRDLKFIENYINNILDKQSDLVVKYNATSAQLDKLNKFLKYNDEIKDYSQYYDISDKNVQSPIINFNTVSILIKGLKFESGIKGKFVKLNNILNTIELSNELPFIAFSDRTTVNPIVKIYNGVSNLDGISDREIKSWIVNEKKKTNQMFYKKIKGILLKYKVTENDYMTVSLYDNGLMEAKIQFSDTEVDESDDFAYTSLDNIIKLLKEKLDKLIDYINTLQGVFLQSRRLEKTSESEIMLESVSASIKTNYLIDRFGFSNILNNEAISNYVFETKETISKDILSFYYKKFGRKQTDEIEIDRKGITVNVRENPYKLDSSIINIYSAYNLYQISAIVKQIVLITKLYKPQKIQQKIKEKSNISMLRKQGAVIESTKCQKGRQPIIDPKATPLGSSYIIDFEGNKYMCPHEKYPYPGFTAENIVCCFAKDQRGSESYIRNMKSKDFEIMIAPSNLKIDVLDPVTKEKFTTFALKIVSEYMEGFDSTNSMSNYYFLNNENELIPIRDERLIKRLDVEEREDNEIWLDSVPLAKLITEPPKNKCNYTPNINNKTQDINSPCEHHEKNKFFGYNLNSYPCCFDKERNVYITRKRKEFDITKQHILKSDKILNYQRIGVLPEMLDKLFNEIIFTKNDNGKYYRMGVIQDNSAFFGAIRLALQNKINDIFLNNTTEFRKMITTYLDNNQNIFETLNNGNISMKFGSIEKYKNYIMDFNTVVYHNDVIDILERMANVNIIILDVPYVVSKSTQIYDYNNIKIVCKKDIPEKSKANPFIVLLKRHNVYEIIIKMKGSEKHITGIDYTMIYDPQTDAYKKNIINFIMEYYATSCVRENVYPDKFMFNEMFELREIMNILDDTSHEIIAQIINVYNKVDIVLTKSNFIIPIRESGIDNYLQKVKLQTLKDENKLLNLVDYIKILSDINDILSNQNLQKMKIYGATVIDKTTIINAIFTSYGQFIPIKEEDISKYIITENNKSFIDISEPGMDIEIPIIDFKYYVDINEYLSDIKQTDNPQNDYIHNINKIKQSIFIIKTQLGKQFSDSDRELVDKINKNTKLERSSKIKLLVDLFKTKSIKTDLTEKELIFILKNIANEVINDNKENLLMNNLIISDVFDPNEITKRDSESILFNIDDIRKWLKRNIQQENVTYI